MEEDTKKERTRRSKNSKERRSRKKQEEKRGERKGGHGGKKEEGEWGDARMGMRDGGGGGRKEGRKEGGRERREGVSASHLVVQFSGRPAEVSAARYCSRTLRTLLTKPLDSGKSGKPMSG